MSGAGDAIDVFAADEQSDQPVDLERWVALARGVLAAEGVRPPAEVSLLFVDTETIAELNERFLEREGPTDVLAFPIDEEPAGGGRAPDTGGPGPGGPGESEPPPQLVGDVVICPAVAAANAIVHVGSYPGHAGHYADEIALLVVHGLLHLRGWDHEEDADAEAMEARERHLLGQLYARAAGGGAANGPVGMPAGTEP